MSLNFAILGLLSLEPMSGYTLKSRYFDRSIAHFWPADQAQIYRTLQALESRGQAESHVLASDTRPASRVYQLTEAGSAALQDWLAQDQPVSVSRDGFLVQLYFARVLSRDQILAVLRARRAAHLAQQSYFHEIQLPDAESDEMSRQLIFGAMTLDFARRRERMMVEWLDACIEAVQALPETSSPAT
ncbi:MAG: PadR family transcriptional regulator [Paracoccus sp. (in: a-proteobacteria)]